jgi:hypothetical protein
MAAKRVMEVAQNASVMEPEQANANFRVELEQAQIKIAEMDEHQSSLRSGYEKLGSECENLHNVAEILKQEKVFILSVYNFIFKSFILPVFNLDLLELYIFLNDLNWRMCLRG